MDTDTPRRGPLLGLLFRLAHQEWANEVDAALSDAGFGDIRPHHANVFAFVPAEGIQVSELARKARVRKQTMAHTVDQLERLGYATRTPDPSDGRAQLVKLTERGRAVRPVGVKAGRRVEEKWTKATSEEDVEGLRHILMKLIALRDG